MKTQFTQVKGQTLTGERAAYGSRNVEFVDCDFEDGESPLKECRNLIVKNCRFGWKYPLWYVDGATLTDVEWLQSGRSGVWYTQNLQITHCFIGAPKQFRRCNNLQISDSKLPCAEETLWNCTNVTLQNVDVVGDYFGMNCQNVQLTNVRIDGNYCFDGAKNVEAHNCTLNSKDAFWNCENVTVYNSVIYGEYLAWNSRNVKFVNCTMESHQGFCYTQKLTLDNCSLTNSDLCFELCSDIDVQVTTKLHSVKNPISGRIRCCGLGKLVMDDTIVDPSKTIIEVLADE